MSYIAAHPIPQDGTEEHDWDVTKKAITRLLSDPCIIHYRESVRDAAFPIKYEFRFWHMSPRRKYDFWRITAAESVKNLRAALPTPVTRFRNVEAFSKAIEHEKEMVSDGLRLIIDKISASTGRPLNILDHGCGTFFIGHKLVEEGHRVVGFDPDPAMIEYAKRAYPKQSRDQRFDLLFDYREVQFLDCEFDVGLMVFVHQIATQRSELKCLIQAASSKLRKDGRVIVVGANPEALGLPFSSVQYELPKEKQLADMNPGDKFTGLIFGPDGREYALDGDHYWPIQELQNAINEVAGAARNGYHNPSCRQYLISDTPLKHKKSGKILRQAYTDISPYFILVAG